MSGTETDLDRYDHTCVSFSQVELCQGKRETGVVEITHTSTISLATTGEHSQTTQNFADSDYPHFLQSPQTAQTGPESRTGKYEEEERRYGM